MHKNSQSLIEFPKLCQESYTIYYDPDILSAVDKEGNLSKDNVIKKYNIDLRNLFTSSLSSGKRQALLLLTTNSRSLIECLS